MKTRKSGKRWGRCNARMLGSYFQLRDHIYRGRERGGEGRHFLEELPLYFIYLLPFWPLWAGRYLLVELIVLTLRVNL